ncbi:glycosyltransferase family 25 protein [Marivita sp. S2033]|uniref:glycosyltransferase family 25 protein n=1 Tax=Marivita sp. S2033 TaxID=3373187 RepID=UPI003981C338
MQFPPIYILSLESAQRFGPLAEALRARGLDYEVFWGIDGRTRLPGIHEPCVDRPGAEARMGRPMTDGEFACALSHRQIYERIAAGDAPSAIVLEDDADPGEAFFELGPALANPPCGLLLFDHKNTYVRVRDRLILPGGVRAFRVALPPFLATGYMVSREVAAHLAFRNGPVVQPSDWPDAILQFDSYACDPRVVTQRGRTVGTSSLEAGRRAHKHKRRKSLRRLLYKSYWRRWMTKRLARKLA